MPSAAVVAKADLSLRQRLATRLTQRSLHNGGPNGLRLIGKLHRIGFAEASHELKTEPNAIASIAERGCDCRDRLTSG